MNKKKLFSVLVKARAKRDLVKKTDDISFEISVKAPPKQGKANARVIEILADYFKTAKSNIQITHGLKSKRKIIEIE